MYSWDVEIINKIIHVKNDKRVMGSQLGWFIYQNIMDKKPRIIAMVKKFCVII